MPIQLPNQKSENNVIWEFFKPNQKLSEVTFNSIQTTSRSNEQVKQLKWNLKHEKIYKTRLKNPRNDIVSQLRPEMEFYFGSGAKSFDTDQN